MPTLDRHALVDELPASGYTRLYEGVDRGTRAWVGTKRHAARGFGPSQSSPLASPVLAQQDNNKRTNALTAVQRLIQLLHVECPV